MNIPVVSIAIADHQRQGQGQGSSKASLPGPQPLCDITDHQNLPMLEYQDQKVFSNLNSSPSSDSDDDEEDFDQNSEITSGSEEADDVEENVCIHTIKNDLKLHECVIREHQKDSLSYTQELKALRQTVLENKAKTDAREAQLSRKINDDIQKVHGEIEELKTATHGLQKRVSVLEDHNKEISSHSNTVKKWIEEQKIWMKSVDGRLQNCETGAPKAGPSKSRHQYLVNSNNDKSGNERDHGGNSAQDDDPYRGMPKLYPQTPINIADAMRDYDSDDDIQMPTLYAQVPITISDSSEEDVKDDHQASKLHRQKQPPNPPVPPTQRKKSQRIQERQVNAKKIKVSRTSVQATQTSDMNADRYLCKACMKYLRKSYKDKHELTKLHKAAVKHGK